MNTERIPPQIVGVTSATLWEGKIHRHAMVGSTMDEARTLAVHGARHGTVVIAGAQNAGRGRSGRTWLSPPGNLYMTLVLRPPPEPRLAPATCLCHGHRRGGSNRSARRAGFTDQMAE